MAISPTAASRGRCRTSRRFPRYRSSSAPTRGLPALRARREDLGRPWALPGTPGARAPHRRPREGPHGRGHVRRPRTTTMQTEVRAEKILRMRAEIPAPAPEGADERRPPRGRLGRHLRRAPEASEGPRTRARRSAGYTCAGSTRSPRVSTKVFLRFRRVLVAELNLGQLCRVLRARVSRRCAHVHQGAGHAVHGPRGDDPGPPAAPGRLTAPADDKVLSEHPPRARFVEAPRRANSSSSFDEGLSSPTRTCVGVRVR